jgi:Rrf2 family transcriptional regulator, iron-sulfur cluster assembly transcription factor
VKGPGGGYVLNKEPQDISIGAILRELDGPVAITSCLDPKEGCMRIEGCVTHLLWKSLGEKIEAFLDNMTLKDLLEGQSPAGLSGRRQKKNTGRAVPVRLRI